MSIGTLGEKSLHAALKRWYARPDDQIECVVEGYHIDLVRALTELAVEAVAVEQELDRARADIGAGARSCHRPRGAAWC